MAKINQKTPKWYEDLESKYLELFCEKQQIERALEDVKQQLHNHLKAYDIQSVSTELTCAYLVKSQHVYMDAKRFKQDHPALYQKYLIKSDLPERVQVKVK